MRTFAAVLLLACAAYGAIPAGWNYDPFLYYPFTSLQPPVQDTPEVAAARAAHMAAHAAALNPAASAREIPAGWNYDPFLFYPFTPFPAPAQETPEVAAARAAHMAAHAEARSRNARSVMPVQGVQDTPEVWAAKMEHFRAYTAAAAANGAAVPAAYHYQHIQDTPEVWAAKQEFFRAYNDALLRLGK